MSKIESEIVTIDQPREKIFHFLNDFNNFEKLMPPQVTDWQSTANSCSFVINGMATVGMKIRSATLPSEINIVSDGGKLPFEFKLDVLLKEITPASCTGQLIFDADIPVFLRPMIEAPLKNFFNMLAVKMKDIT
jgi:hypothetical protein